MGACLDQRVYEALKNYAGFSGRARAREYWSFYLVNIVVFFVLLGLDYLFFPVDAETGLGLLSGLYGVVTLLPSIAVAVRRLHDTGRHGGWLLVGLVPVVGGAVLLYFLSRNSQAGNNSYGANPKGIETV
jgi:uncharacterized membrane protein YhaH (DUF805 family)